MSWVGKPFRGQQDRLSQSVIPTIKAKILWSDPATKRRAQLTRYEPGAFLSMHRHVGDELLYVIEGSISDESGTVSAGSAGYRPDGCIHRVTSKNGATIFAVITGGVEPANEIGIAPASRTFAQHLLERLYARYTREAFFWSASDLRVRARAGVFNKA